MMMILGTAQGYGALVLVEDQSPAFVGPQDVTLDVEIVTNFLEFPGVGILADQDTTTLNIEPLVPPTIPTFPGLLRAANASFGEDRFFFRASEAALVPDPSLPQPGTPNPSTMFTATAATVYLTDRLDPGNTGFLSGAQPGDDNWVYFSNNNVGATAPFPTFWAKIDISADGTSATPVAFVWDPNDPLLDFTLAEALEAAPVPEPSLTLLLALGALGLTSRCRRATTF